MNSMIMIFSQESCSARHMQKFRCAFSVGRFVGIAGVRSLRPQRLKTIRDLQRPFDPNAET